MSYFVFPQEFSEDCGKDENNFSYLKSTTKEKC